jgi:hypothetical protein
MVKFITNGGLKGLKSTSTMLKERMKHLNKA